MIISTLLNICVHWLNLFRGSWTKKELRTNSAFNFCDKLMTGSDEGDKLMTCNDEGDKLMSCSDEGDIFHIVLHHTC